MDDALTTVRAERKAAKVAEALIPKEVDARLPPAIEAHLRQNPPKPGRDGLTGAPGRPGTDGRAGKDGTDGKPGLVWRGKWKRGRTYQADDAVEHKGSSYVATGEVDREPPKGWDLLAAKGEDGKDGVSRTMHIGGGGGGSSGSGLPAGGSVGQVVTNTAPGVGAWDDITSPLNGAFVDGGYGGSVYFADAPGGGMGGQALIQGGDATTGDNRGGIAQVIGGEGFGDGDGGEIRLLAGASPGAGDGAAALVRGGSSSGNTGGEMRAGGASPSAHGKIGITTDNSTGTAGQVLTADGAGLATWEDASGGGAPTDAPYYVTTANAGLSAEVVVPAFIQTLLDDTTQGAAQTTLGLGTGDSPQVTALNIGHATDTTLARSGAGDLTVEGNALYRAGGTDVAVADGGTGASTAATARTNLDLGLVVPVKPPFRTALYYGSWDGAMGTVAVVKSTQYATPFYVPETVTADRIGVLVTGVANTSVNLSIYNDTAGVPDTLVVDAGNVASTSTAFVEKTISQSLVRGWYWLACAAQSSDASNCSIFCNTSANVASTVLPVAAPFSGFTAGGYATTGVTGAAPSPWGATKTETARVPVMFLRFSAV